MLLGEYNTPPTCLHSSAGAAAGNDDSARGAVVPLGGATPSSDSVRSPSCQLQSGLLIKPHETNKAHNWDLQSVGNAGT